MTPSSMTLTELLATGRKIWGEEPYDRMVLRDIVYCLGVVFGDICRATRDGDPELLKKEFGNLLLSTVRWMDDLGLDIGECLKLAERAQRDWAERRRLK